MGNLIGFKNAFFLILLLHRGYPQKTINMSTRFLSIICFALLLFTSQCNISRPITSSTTKGVSTSNRTRQNIVNYAKQQQGTPYKYGGRTPRGFDCSGFTHYVYNEFDVELTPVSRVQETEGRKVALKDVQPGDLIFFRKNRAGAVFHVALVVNNNEEGISVVHSTTSRGVIVENISKSSYWKSKISSARSFL